MRVNLYLCSNERPMSEHPLGLAYLKANCSDSADVRMNVHIVTDRRELGDCDLVGLSSDAAGLKEAVQILDEVNTPVMIGGQGTLWPGLADYPFFMIVQGEGEGAFRSLLEDLKMQLLLWDDYRVLHPGHGRVVQGIPVGNLDELVIPDRGKCDWWVPILTSRGCPYSCRFCSSQEFWGRPRFRSAENIVEEAIHLSWRYPDSGGLYFLEDLFAINKPRLRKLCELWIENHLHERWQSHGFVQASSFDEEVAELMVRMGFRSSRFGAESGSDRVLREVLGKTTTVAQNQATIDIALAAGLQVGASYMGDIPGETPEEAQATRDFIARNPKCGVEQFYRFVSFPGTKLWDGRSPLEASMEVR